MSNLNFSAYRKKSISKDDICYLISVTTTLDDLMQEIEVETNRQVFCDKLSIGQKEFALSAQSGLKAEMIIVIDKDEYNDEEKLIYKNQKYSIYRTFVRNDGDIELYCERRVGDGN